MQFSKQKTQLRFVLLVVAILIGGLMIVARTSQAAPVTQESGDDGALNNTLFLPLVAGSADSAAAGTPLTPDQYDAESEAAPVLSDEQLQASTWCSTYIKFSNSSSYSIKIYYVNSWGSESLYKTLSSGSSYWQHSYYGNSWKVRDNSGNLLKSLTANSCSTIYVTINNSDFPQPTATPTSSGGGACYTEIIATHSNKCMDVAGASSSNNVQIQQYSCSGGDNQKFFFSPVSGKANTYVIRAKHSGKAVDVISGSRSAGKDLVQYSANGSTSQQWQIVSVGGNIFELKNINSGLIADVEGSSSSNGAHVIQWNDLNGANQRWKIESCLGQQPTPTNTAVPPTPTNTPVPTNTPAPQLGSIGDRVWNDFNRNGIQDGGEPGVANVTVQLKNCSGGVLQSTTTNGSGIYTFGNLAAGCYTIGIVVPGGFQLSPKAQGTDGALDSDINIGNAMSDNINLGAGQNITTIDAGINQPVAPTPTNTPAPQLGSIGDKVFRDENNNGQQDGGEPGVANVTVQLKDCSGNVLQSTTTDGNGIYGFSGLAAGCYTIGIVLPDGFTFSPANVGNDNTDSDINPGSATSDPINLGAGQNITNVDAGLVPQGGGGDTCIGDRTWRDNNLNGLQDPGEPGIDGVEIYLGVDANGDGRLDRYLGSTVSANGGQYEFCGLDPATIYALEFSAPPNFCGFTLPNVGNNDAIDSDPDISKGVALGIVVVGGQRNDTIDAGYACHD